MIWRQSLSLSMLIWEVLGLRSRQEQLTWAWLKKLHLNPITLKKFHLNLSTYIFINCPSYWKSELDFRGLSARFEIFVVVRLSFVEFFYQSFYGFDLGHLYLFLTLIFKLKFNFQMSLCCFDFFFIDFVQFFLNGFFEIGQFEGKDCWFVLESMPIGSSLLYSGWSCWWLYCCWHSRSIDLMNV